VRAATAAAADGRLAGAHFLFPVLQYPILFDVRSRPRSLPTVTGTKDLQQVNITLRILFSPIESRIKEIFQQSGTDYDVRIMPSIANEVLKVTRGESAASARRPAHSRALTRPFFSQAVVAQYNADQLLTMRDRVSQDIRESLTKRARDYHVTLDDVSITHLTFSREFSKAIEDKEVAFQQSEAAKFVVQRAEQEKLAVITQAEGEAEAARLISESIARSGGGLVELRRIDAAVAIAETLSKSPNVTYLPSHGGVLLSMPPDHRRSQAAAAAASSAAQAR
jgi:prohibitin 1